MLSSLQQSYYKLAFITNLNFDEVSFFTYLVKGYFDQTVDILRKFDLSLHSWQMCLFPFAGDSFRVAAFNRICNFICIHLLRHWASVNKFSMFVMLYMHVCRSFNTYILDQMDLGIISKSVIVKNICTYYHKTKLYLTWTVINLPPIIINVWQQQKKQQSLRVPIMVVSAFLTFPIDELQNVTGKLSRKIINVEICT